MRDCVLSGLWVPSEDSPLYRFLQPGGENLKIAGVDDVDESESYKTGGEQQPKIEEIEEDDKAGEKSVEMTADKVVEQVAEKADEKVESKQVPTTSCLDEVD